MARIRQVSLSSDLFEDSVNEVIGLPKGMTLETYAEIVKLTTQKYGKLLTRITWPLLIKTVAKRNRNSEHKISLAARGALLVTVVVIEVRGRDVTVSLSFDDLIGHEVPSEIIDTILRDVTAQARCKSLAVKGCALVGQITLSNVVSLPKRKPGSRQKDWPKSGQNDVSIEETFIQQAERIAR